MARYSFEVTLTLKGPVLTNSSAPGAFGLDAPFAKDAQGRPFLPGTLVKGRIRHAMAEMREAIVSLGEPNPDAYIPEPESWFGPPNVGGGGNRRYMTGPFARHNTRIFFTDFVCQDKPPGRWRRRIAMDEARHAADEQMMQILESPVDAGENIAFTGTITLDATGSETKDCVQWRIFKALRWTGCFGANVSVGFGRLSNAKVSSAPEPAVAAKAPAGDVLYVRLTPDRQFCVTEYRGAENLFESGCVIPGAVLKGAIAAHWERWGKPVPKELAANFHLIRVTHARPAPASSSTVPVAVPLSVAEVAGGFRDYARYPDPPADLDEAVAFAPDFKGDLKPRFGWPKAGEIRRELRVRTAIDRDKRRAQDRNLFAYEMVCPDGLKWYSRFDLNAIPEAVRPRVRAQLLEVVADGIHAVGKTKATLGMEWMQQEPEPRMKSSLSAREGVYVVTLQSPALLLDPLKLSGLRDGESLIGEYRRVFGLMTDALDLKHLFAQHRMRGGLFLYKRFQEGRLKDGSAAPYEPYLLTESGSVFVFEVVAGRERDAQSFLSRWMNNGVGVPAWARERFARNGEDGAHWKNNPYVPENGFGEVAVNLPIHFDEEVF